MGRVGSERRPRDRRPFPVWGASAPLVSHPAGRPAAAALRPPALPSGPRATREFPRPAAARPAAAPEARVLGRAHPHPDGILWAPRRRDGDRVSGRCARLGGQAVSASRSYDIVIIGSGAGGGTVALELDPLVRDGGLVSPLEEGSRFSVY